MLASHAASAGRVSGFGPAGSWFVRGWITGPGGRELSAAAAGGVQNRMYAAMARTGKKVDPAAWLSAHHTGEGSRDAVHNRFLRTCDVADSVPVPLARRAAWLRARARSGPPSMHLSRQLPSGGTVLTGDLADLRALARHASDVAIESI